MPNPSASSVGGGKFTFRNNGEERPEQCLQLSGQEPSPRAASTPNLPYLRARGIWDVNSGPCIVSEP